VPNAELHNQRNNYLYSLWQEIRDLLFLAMTGYKAYNKTGKAYIKSGRVLQSKLLTNRHAYIMPE